MLAGYRPAPIEILPENHRAVRAFLVASTQWRISPNGVAYGIDYVGAKIAWDVLDFQLSADDFARVQILEREAVNVMRD